MNASASWSIAWLGWLLVTQFPSHARFATADNQSNFYVVGHDGGVSKLDSNGTVTYRYQHNDAPQNLDVGNPLKVVLYYPHTQTVTMLDNTLTPIATLQLLPLHFTQVSAACRSSDEKIWLYDASDFKLKKIDYDGTRLREGTDLLQQIGFAPDVRFMIEADQHVYLCDSLHGILVTDVFGSYEKTIPLKSLHEFQIIGNRIVAFNAAQMVTYDLLSAQTDTAALAGVEPFTSAAYGDRRLLTLDQNRVSLYRKKN